MTRVSVEYWTIGNNEVSHEVILNRRVETVGVVQTTKYRRDFQYINPHNNTPDYDTTGPSYRATGHEIVEERSVIAGMDTVPLLYPGSELVGPLFYTRPYSAIVRITELNYLGAESETFVEENGEGISLGISTDPPDAITRIEWIVKGHGIVRSLPVDGQYLDLILDLPIFNNGSNVVAATSLSDLGLTQDHSTEALRSAGGYLANPSDTYLVTTNQVLEMWPWPVPYAFLPEAHPTWYRDTDGDGYGDPDVSLVSEVRLDGYVLNADDCDDTNAILNLEVNWYQDSDGDGYGNAFVSTMRCEQPAGYVINDADSDDSNPFLNPDLGLFENDAEDPDNDGMTNLEEYALRFNPRMRDNVEALNTRHALLISAFTSNENFELYVREGINTIEVLLECSDSLDFEESHFILGVLTGEKALNGMELMTFGNPAQSMNEERGFVRFVFRETENVGE
jgi:hypothetical protein